MTDIEFLESIFRLESFQTPFQNLVIASVAGEFPGLLGELSSQLTDDLPYLITVASLLAQSTDGNHHDASLRIAQYCLQKSHSDQIKAGSATVLHALTNNPALALSYQRKLIKESFLDDIPTPLRIDALKRSFETTIFVKDKQFSFTRFQAEVFRSANEYSWLSISAPTSAGKSYILSRLVGHFLDTGFTRIAFIVPTRALIQQVLTDLTNLNFDENREDVLVTTMPQIPKDLGNRKCIFVLTQERMHWLLSQPGDDIDLQLLIVDEAQKIGDGARGVLLQQVIERAVRQFTKMRVLFSAPMTANPQVLLEDAPEGKKTGDLTSTLPTVNQNLIWVEQITGKPKDWIVNLLQEGEIRLLGQIKLPDQPNISKRLPFVAYAMTNGSTEGGCLIYVNGQDEAEKTAFILSQLIHQADPTDVEIVNLISLIDKTVHPKYVLKKVLKHQVAFHYGNMPLLIRSEIERLFKCGKIRFLVCTATLIEGVNLPAKYIFMRGPRKGKEPLLESDFWNLAGRAGRLGKEYQGSVVCVDPRRLDAWKIPPPKEKRNYTIRRALDGIMSDINSFSTYLAEESIKNSPQRNSNAEHALVFCAELLSRENTLTNHPWAKRLPASLLIDIEAKVRATLKEVEISDDIVSRNPGVSPIAQQRLLLYFRSFTKPLEELIPYPPEDPDAVKLSYVRIIGRMSKHLSGDHQAMCMPRAILVVNWMRGYSLRRMIDDNIKYWEQRKSTSAVIRGTMEDVEQYARFKFVKFASCYIDILTLFLKERDRADLIESIPPIQIYSEFGASQQTQMSLMDLGLSRVSAIEISGLMISTNLSRDECIKWMSDNDLSELNISPIVLNEIDVFKKAFTPSKLNSDKGNAAAI